MSPSGATLTLTVRDSATRQTVPARIHLKRKDGSCYLPPLPLEKRFTDSAVPPYILPQHFHDNLHRCKEVDIQSVHMTSGTATIPIPAEELTVWVARGHERIPVRKTFSARKGEAVHLEVVLPGLEDLAGQGWHSGDMHVHFTRRSRRDDRILALLMAAEDLPAVNNMVYKHAGKIEAPQRTIGHEDSHYHLHHHHQVISGGVEFRDDDLHGHMICAGITKVIEPISVGQKLGRCDSYPLFSQVCEWTRQQGGIAGWAHGGAGIKLHETLPVEAALGGLDFIESIQFNRFFGFYFWYRLLNCGLRLAVTGGSDFPFNAKILAPWYPNLGLDRTYVRMGTRRPFSYDAYMAGIRRGRSFATNGPLLWLDVDGHGPGATVRLDSGRAGVLVSARARSAFPLERLELIVNGAVEHIEHGKGGPREIACEVRLRIPQSSWVAARARGQVAPEIYGGVAPWNQHAHSSPVYLLRNGKPAVQRADATAMGDYVRYIGEIYRKNAQYRNPRHKALLLQNFKRAERYYDRLLRR